MDIKFRQSGYPLGRAGRLLLVAAVIAVLAGFGLAFRLNPDPRGFGTHEDLGLPPCTIQLAYSLPCPSCGMTTSFAHFVRGEIPSAARANPGGLLLALICALLVPWACISCIRGEMWKVSQPDVLLLSVIAVVAIVTMTQWGFRVLILR